MYQKITRFILYLNVFCWILAPWIFLPLFIAMRMAGVIDTNYDMILGMIMFFMLMISSTYMLLRE